MKRYALPRTAVYGLHVLFWICYGAILYAAVSNWNDSPSEVWRTVTTDVVSSSAICYLNILWLLPKLYGRQKYFLYVVIALSIVFVVIYLRVNIFHVGLRHKAISYTYFIRSIPAFGFYLLSTVVWFVSNLISSQRRETELRNSQLDSELKFLKLQLSPHFLFNTLNNIYSMAYFSDVNTAPAILMLSGMMRHMIFDDQGKFIPLVKEITFMENFIELWRLKVEEKTTVTFKHSGVREGQLIAHLIFLVFLENAFKHGNNANGSVDIRLDVTGSDILTFQIKNDVLETRSTLDERSGIGLANVRKRLELIYPDKHRLTLKEDTTSFEVNLTIDLK